MCTSSANHSWLCVEATFQTTAIRQSQYLQLSSPSLALDPEKCLNESIHCLLAESSVKMHKLHAHPTNAALTRRQTHTLTHNKSTSSGSEREREEFLVIYSWEDRFRREELKCVLGGRAQDP